MINFFLYLLVFAVPHRIVDAEMTKFCANLAFLFTESNLLERYNLAKNAGFKCVETGFPFGFTREEVVKAKTSSGLEQVLINIYTGDVTKGELGFAALPGKEQEFKESIHKTIQYAKDLGVRKIHIMSGRVLEGVSQANDNAYLQNLKYAAGLLEKENIVGLIEPINSYSVPNYYMNSYKKAVEVVETIKSPNLKIMLDIFHLQHIQGNVSNTIKDLMKYIGHVQIAQVPNRNEPNTDGELNYKYILDLLRKEGYTDWIGLEYKPKSDTLKGLNWIKEMGYSL
ncbi:putative hydroxypyruvate isomerase [Coccinella septempunctata]|uniref:putative hydroxypyruvate isomerase n=1 Tax=Coccinella septempunctata TaxID=41139 RepID=UPI001D098B7E|nr:putative hydroxypyruvate isomerase [Coccinella septempunctata]